ncbi:MAG: hypothetical protein QS748_02225 [Candidatus Endonucleobacter bathymodioli]|uniref:Uncharacterized protein n=1 Tax=Candidatus Endonucleibacter bathymodioli TaxID=539814 RepID=A0AA90NK93_9GAMM|nr:hypothetical protein [Candidatus Endonucleobacter bathymodioli]
MNILKWLPNVIFVGIINFFVCFQVYAYIDTDSETDSDKQVSERTPFAGLYTPAKRCQAFVKGERSADFKRQMEELMVSENAYYHSCSFIEAHREANIGKGDHIVLKAKDRNKYIIVSYFSSEAFANGFSINDRVDLPIEAERHFCNWFLGVNHMRSISYVYSGMTDSGMITDSAKDDSETYRGTDGYGVTVKVRIPMDQWCVYSVEYDSAGRVRDRQFSPDIHKFIHNRFRARDYIVSPISDYFRDSYIESVVSNPIVHALALMFVFKNRHTVAAGAMGATIAVGKGVQAISSGGVVLVGSAYHAVNFILEASPVTSAMNLLYIYNLGLTRVAKNYLSFFLKGDK